MAAKPLPAAGQRLIKNMDGVIIQDFIITTHAGDNQELIPEVAGKTVVILDFFCEPDGTSGTLRLRSGTTMAASDNIFEMDVSADTNEANVRTPWGLCWTAPSEGVWIYINQTTSLNTHVKYAYVDND